MSAPINKRLLACASLVREGAVLGDIGTDHGYLPIYLLEKGIISRAVLSDINEGPLAKAKANIAAAGLSDKAELKLCDGASALCEMGITDYCIAGMGGELIAAIIAAAPHLHREGIRLILQPMSKQEILRSYLWDNGFSIERELYVTDEGKHYVCLMVIYVGGAAEYSSADALFGKEECFLSVSEPMLCYMRSKKSSLMRVIEGKRLGAQDSSEEQMLLSSLIQRLDKTNRKA